MKTIILAVLLLASTVQAAETYPAEGRLLHKWECKEFTAPYTVLVTAEIRIRDIQYGENAFEYGRIMASGITTYAHSFTTGLERWWRFGTENEIPAVENGTSYSFVIRPNGTGAYFDFTGTAKGESIKPDLVTKCNKIF